MATRKTPLGTIHHKNIVLTASTYDDFGHTEEYLQIKIPGYELDTVNQKDEMQIIEHKSQQLLYELGKRLGIY